MGTHWLRILGEILWDFPNLIVKFSSAGKEVTLKGLSDKILDGFEMEKAAKRQPTATGAFIQILAMNGGKITNRTENEEPEIQQLLDIFVGIFREPTSLPPYWTQDHHIPLQPGSSMVCSRPYHCPYYQKRD